MALLRARIRREPLLPRQFSSLLLLAPPPSSTPTCRPNPPVPTRRHPRISSAPRPPPPPPFSSRLPPSLIRTRLRRSAGALRLLRRLPRSPRLQCLRLLSPPNDDLRTSFRHFPQASSLDPYHTQPLRPVLFRAPLHRPLRHHTPRAQPPLTLRHLLGLRHAPRQLSNYDELGKRLGDLRPRGGGARTAKEWFSLEELSARVGRLREMEKEERERATLPGKSTEKLRAMLLEHSVQTQDQKKTGGVLSVAALMGFGGQTVQGKPQEELMERVSLEGCDFRSCSLQYFHPDHMSSAEKMKLELQRVRDEFKMSENDCGSARVQGNLFLP
ncbi:hypothetical protein HU200_003961 [Digitaria exilis]|uniref:Uncharacterized protein n=1 Tax=Digitaria exilis TaxID=1010633 RepID=A0A835KU76_9POAL|nr:hypothetical protein HU200_003961 [Digitaria exilis]